MTTPDQDGEKLLHGASTIFGASAAMLCVGGIMHFISGLGAATTILCYFIGLMGVILSFFFLLQHGEKIAPIIEHDEGSRFRCGMILAGGSLLCAGLGFVHFFQNRQHGAAIIFAIAGLVMTALGLVGLALAQGMIPSSYLSVVSQLTRSFFSRRGGGDPW